MIPYNLPNLNLIFGTDLPITILPREDEIYFKIGEYEKTVKVQSPVYLDVFQEILSIIKDDFTQSFGLFVLYGDYKILLQSARLYDKVRTENGVKTLTEPLQFEIRGKIYSIDELPEDLIVLSWQKNIFKSFKYYLINKE